jgi:serine/threonine protein kinase
LAGEEASAGGMGQVYLARSPGHRLVAVKVILPGLADDEEFRARFAREVATARNVSGLYLKPANVMLAADGPG